MSYLSRFLMPVRKAWKTVLHRSFHDAILGIVTASIFYLLEFAVQSIQDGNIDAFWSRIIIIMGVVVIKFLILVFWKPQIFTIFSETRKYLHGYILPQLIQGDNNAYEKIGTGKIISLYNTGVHTWQFMIFDIFGEGVKSLIFFLFFVVIVGQKSLWLVLGLTGVVLLAGLWLWLRNGSQLGHRRASKDIYTQLQRDQVRWVMNKFEIMQQDKVGRELSKRLIYNDAFVHHKKKEKYYQGIGFEGTDFFLTFGFIGLVGYVGGSIYQGEMDYSDMVSIVGLGSLFLSNMGSILRACRGWIDRRIDISKLFAFLDDISPHRDITAGKELVLGKGKVELKDISYGYDAGVSVFEKFSLTLAPQKKTALVGLSGSGKTTLIKLIAGYITPEGGDIIVDSQGLEDMSLISYYKHIGYLTQEPSIFDGSIRDNLMYGVLTQENSDDEHVRKQHESDLHTALKHAHCDFVYDLVDGIETEIGERGIRLSGGQRQRLAIAKIFLKNPRIILLDEPTSALDSFSEQKVTDAMEELFVGRTVVIVAHRLQTVKHADEIIVLGKKTPESSTSIIERGTHADLIKQDGHYNKMLELQSGF